MEATVVVVDNSEWTRNGDYAPTRFQAQADAVNLLAGAKTQAHPENAVGVLTSGGATPRVLVTPTPDLGAVLNAMQGVRLEPGNASLSRAVQVAQLALKHRQNKNQRQRIVVFVGSPLIEDEATLVKIGKKLKKNNVAVDVVAFFGEEGEGQGRSSAAPAAAAAAAAAAAGPSGGGGGEGADGGEDGATAAPPAHAPGSNAAKLDAFRAAVDSGGNSHLVTVPAGSILSDALFGTPIFSTGDDDFGGGGGGFEFGVDPSLDPELALALRVSMEEEQARQAALAAAAGGGGGGGEGGEGGAAAATGASAAAAAPASGAAAAAADAAEPMDEDALLQQALAMSMQQTDAAGAPAAAAVAAPPLPGGGGGGDDAEDEQLKMALALSMQEADADAGPSPAAAPAPAAAVPGGADYVSGVLGSLPGVDVSDPALQAAVRAATEKEEGEGGGEEEEKK